MSWSRDRHTAADRARSLRSARIKDLFVVDAATATSAAAAAAAAAIHLSLITMAAHASAAVLSTDDGIASSTVL